MSVESKMTFKKMICYVYTNRVMYQYRVVIITERVFVGECRFVVGRSARQ